MGLCETILVGKVLADQTFTCVNTQIALGAFPLGSTLVSITLTQFETDCTPVFTSPVGVNYTFTLTLDVIVSTPGGPVETTPVVTVTCSGSFCGLSIPAADQPLIDCALVQASPSFSAAAFDPITGILTITITIVSQFALLRREILSVALCPGANSGDITVTASCP
ncbi:MAG: hypothetical protein P4N59_07710 [Negativicutes bacterium]|nr:hypothetical protein [Negativicutes bacterium]